MRFCSPNVFLGLGLLLTLVMPARAIAAQSCTLEYYRADNMWATWGAGNLGAETLTLQPGQNRVFATDWAYEKQRNDGTKYYGSHLRIAMNRGAVPVRVNVRGPMLVLIKPRDLALNPTSGIRVIVNNVIHYVRAHSLTNFVGLGPHFLQPGDMAFYRHDLADVSCPGTQITHTATAPPPEPPQPVLLSLTGTRATALTTTLAVTVEAQDANTGAPLTGEVTINGATGATGQAISFTRCTETFEFEDTRGVIRTRTARVPCEGTVKITGYPDTYFTF